MRGKSYTTAELLDTFKASQATQSMFAAASKFSQMLPAAAQALGVVTATGGPNGSTTVTVAATNMGPTGLGANGGDSEERGSMHKAVSDNSMLYLAGADVNDKWVANQLSEVWVSILLCYHAYAAVLVTSLSFSRL
jgi:hypothetical protein